MGEKEGNLTRVSTISATADFIRVVKDGDSSRLITPTNLTNNVLDSLISALGYIKVSDKNEEKVTNTTIDLSLVVGTHVNVFADSTSASITITLPDASTAWDGANNRGNWFLIKKDDASVGNTVTVDGSGAQTIDGSATYTLSGADTPFIKVIAVSTTAWKTIGG
jgi:hypothetical protein